MPPKPAPYASSTAGSTPPSAAAPPNTSPPDPVLRLVASLIAAAADLGFAVDTVHFRTPPPSPTPHWPSVLINGSPHPSQPPHYSPSWHLAQPAYHLQPAYPQQVHYYNHPAYFAAPGPSAHPHAPPNVFWSTVLPSNPQSHVASAASPPTIDRQLVGATNPPQGDAASYAAPSTAAAATVEGIASAPPREFICPRCNSNFKTNSNMQKHVRTVHDNCRPFKCDQCSASYGHKNLLVEHVRTVHDGERPFECETCGARFGRSSNLYSHMKSHDGKREHQCKTCHVSFSLHGNMVKHYKTVHLKQRPFVCDICSSKFGLRSDLMRHVSYLPSPKPLPVSRFAFAWVIHLLNISSVLFWFESSTNFPRLNVCLDETEMLFSSLQKRNVHGIGDKDKDKDGKNAGGRSHNGSSESNDLDDGSKAPETKAADA